MFQNNACSASLGLPQDCSLCRLHVGEHVAPDAREAGQSPLVPWAGAASALRHGDGLHVAAVSVPSRQLLGPDALYPALHVGWHVEPDARLDVQVPTAPLVGAVFAPLHGFAVHVAAVSVGGVPLLLQVLAPDTVYPVLHVG